jgi:iron complex transport system substrate-binding protein
MALFARKSAIDGPMALAWGFFIVSRATQRKFVRKFVLAGMLKIACAAAALLCCSALLRAQAPASPPAPAPATPPAITPAYREVTDELSRSIRIPQPLHRVVSLAPSLTETVYALGLQDLLVGDTDYCDFPPEARNKQKVGGTINPSLEAIAALHPDLVLVTKSLNRLDTVNSLADLGIPSYSTDPHTVDDIISSTQRLADVLGAPDAGNTLAKDLEHRLADTQQRVAALAPRRVFFIVWNEPLISIGKDTFIADALQHAGAVSIVDSSQSWPQINLEEVVRLQPEFLVFADSHAETVPTSATPFADLPGWRILQAVKNHRFAVTSDAVTRPAPRIVDAIEDLAKQFHPEAFVEKPEEKPEGDKGNPDKPNPATPAPPPVPNPSLSSVREHSFAAEEYACVR